MILHDHEPREPDDDSPEVAKAFRAMSSLTDEQRLSVMACFCTNCGCAEPNKGMGCQCWNDE